MFRRPDEAQAITAICAVSKQQPKRPDLPAQACRFVCASARLETTGKGWLPLQLLMQLQRALLLQLHCPAVPPSSASCLRQTSALCTDMTSEPAAAHPAAASTATEAAVPRSSTPTAAAEPHVPTQKELLAASLFGEGNSSRPARQKRQQTARAPTAAPGQPPAHAHVAQAPAAPDLLLQLDSPSHAATQAANAGEPSALCQC